MMLNKLFPLLLMLISFAVMAGLTRGADMWPWITMYWIVLTMKNLYDVLFDK